MDILYRAETRCASLYQWPELQRAVVENAARITELARAIADIDNSPIWDSHSFSRAREWRAGERAYLEGKLAEREEAADELSELVEDAEFALDRISEFLRRKEDA